MAFPCKKLKITFTSIKPERMLHMKITLQPQECSGQYLFDGKIVYAKAFGEVFQDKTTEIILASMSLIFDLVSKNIADYLQVLTVEKITDKIKFWVIDNGSYITYLLPSDY